MLYEVITKLSGAVIAKEYQEEAIVLLDTISTFAENEGIVDLIWIENNQLAGDLIMPKALDKYAEDETFQDDIALRSLCHYFYDLIRGEKE